jgi:hypothetical protein
MPSRLLSAGGPAAATKTAEATGGVVERVGGDFVGLVGDVVVWFVGGERGRKVWVVVLVLVVAVLMVMGLVVVVVGAVEEVVAEEAIVVGFGWFRFWL